MTTKKYLAVLGLVMASLTATVAQAHAKLGAAEPKAGSAMTATPKEIRLHFNEALEPAFSKIELLDSKNVAIKLPKTLVDKADTKVMSVPLPVLGAGQYLVHWSTMTHDGHKAKGDYRFQLK